MEAQEPTPGSATRTVTLTLRETHGLFVLDPGTAAGPVVASIGREIRQEISRVLPRRPIAGLDGGRPTEQP